MKTAVWDTYVKREDGRMMHFDIIVPEELKDEEKIFSFGKEYLKEKNEKYEEFGAKESKFCHIESAKPEVQDIINKKGYYIVEMENCD